MCTHAWKNGTSCCTFKALLENYFGQIRYLYILTHGLGFPALLQTLKFWVTFLEH